MTNTFNMLGLITKATALTKPRSSGPHKSSPIAAETSAIRGRELAIYVPVASEGGAEATTCTTSHLPEWATRGEVLT